MAKKGKSVGKVELKERRSEKKVLMSKSFPCQQIKPFTPSIAVVYIIVASINKGTSQQQP